MPAPTITRSLLVGGLDTRPTLPPARLRSGPCGVGVLAGSLPGQGSGESEFGAHGQEILVAAGDDEIGSVDTLGRRAVHGVVPAQGVTVGQLGSAASHG